jgi:hypothetical protein
LALSTVVDENWRAACHNMVRVLAACTATGRGEHVEVVVVVAGDGEVPHPPVVDLRGGAAVGGGDSAVGGLEAFTLRKFIRRNPVVQIRIPEEVAGGGVDDLDAAGGLDAQVIQVGVVVDLDW